MSYLEGLRNIKDKIQASSDFDATEQLTLIEMIEERENQENRSDDSFVNFYEDVISESLDFDFEGYLTTIPYQSCQREAVVCLSLVPNFNRIKEDESILSWLQSAIRFTNPIILHYIQEIEEIELESVGDYGPERSRYAQVVKGDFCAKSAGRIMDNLYGERNKLEHPGIEVTDENKVIIPLKSPKKAYRMIKRNYPRALKCFLDCFKSHYE